jgi:hypothetical protein
LWVPPVQAYLGPPSAAARYEILRSGVLELARAGLIAGTATASYVTIFRCAVRSVTYSLDYLIGEAVSSKSGVCTGR